MPATNTLKSNRTRANNALVRKETEATQLLQKDWHDGEAQELEDFYQSVGKVLLNLSWSDWNQLVTN